MILVAEETGKVEKRRVRRVLIRRQHFQEHLVRPLYGRPVRTLQGTPKSLANLFPKKRAVPSPNIKLRHRRPEGVVLAVGLEPHPSDAAPQGQPICLRVEAPAGTIASLAERDPKHLHVESWIPQQESGPLGVRERLSSDERFDVFVNPRSCCPVIASEEQSPHEKDEQKCQL
jgi:hypothetical protein